jgi:hypothetical protein
MTNIQAYLDAFYFLTEHTDVLSRFGITLVISIILGTFMLNKFKIWLWVVMMGVFLALTQWQVQAVMYDLGFSSAQIMRPHIITIVSGILFVSGSGIGYYIKHHFALAYTNESPEAVAKEIITEINGGVIENSTLSKTT